MVYNGIAHAVMLATPADLEDFAIGFSLSECIVGRAGEVLDLEIIEGGSGIEVQMQITAERAQALKRHRRSLAGRTGCGLCGTESLDQLARRSARVKSSTVLAEGASSCCAKTSVAITRWTRWSARWPVAGNASTGASC